MGSTWQLLVSHFASFFHLENLPFRPNILFYYKGHPEAFETPLGLHILEEFHRRNMLVTVCIDEFHQGTNLFFLLRNH